MAKTRLGKNAIQEAIDEADYSEYVVVIRREYEIPGIPSKVTFVPKIFGKIKIQNYVRYINLDTKLENKFVKKIESFKTLKAAENFMEKNRALFELVLNDTSKVRLEVLKKIVDFKWDLMMKKDSSDTDQDDAERDDLPVPVKKSEI